MASIKPNLVLEVLPKVEALSSRVIRVLGLNPGPHTLQGTNTYILGNGDRRVLIDAGENNKPDYLQLLQETLSNLKVRLSHIVVTHWHPDHIGGVEEVWKMIGDPFPKVSKLPHSPFSNRSDSSFFSSPVPINHLSDGDVISEEGVTLRVVATPGHSDDHVALLFEEEGSVFSGDCILGQGTAVFEDLKDYIDSLLKIKRLNPTLIYPGHGPVLKDPMPVIDGYIEHRLKRETQILDILKSFPDPVESMEIVEILYKDVPKNLWKSANNNVTLHLEKLHKEGKVLVSDGSKYMYAV